MKETVTLKADVRSDVGTRAARKLRRGGQLPAVIYGHGEAVESVSVAQHEVGIALSHGARLLEVEVSGKTQQCLIKEVQYDHLGASPIHLDLTRVDIHERVRVTVGIELRGVPKGVAHGGVLDQHLAEIDVECMVSDIPETLHPLVTELEVGQSLLVKDVELPPGVVAVTNGDERVASVHVLAAAEPEVAVAAAEGTEKPAEPERIGRVREDQEKVGEEKS